MRHLEHQIAVACMQWWAIYANAKGIDPRLLFAIPNGGRRERVTAALLKAEGVRPGIPDYFLAWPQPAMSVGGAFIELKAPGGRLSPVQESMIQSLAHQGYAAKVCYGADEFIDFVEGYIGVGLGRKVA